MPSLPVGASADESELSLKLDIRPDQIAVLTIDQPNSKANVLSPYLWADLAGVLSRLKTRTDFRGLMLQSGKPGMFVAGADLNELANAPADDPGPTRAFIEQGLAVLADLEALPFPTVALVDGYCLGGGLEVVLACDYRVAGTNSKALFGLPETSLGLIPGWGGTARLPRVMDVQGTFEMLLSGTQFSAPMARERRLVNGVVPSERLADEGARLLHESHATGDWRKRRERKHGQVPICAADKQSPTMPPEAWNALMLTAESFRLARERVRQERAGSPTLRAALEVTDVLEKTCNLPLHQAIPVETEAFLRLAGTPEARRLIADFFAKRKK